MNRFTAWFAVKVTSGVGTMWCAYAFAALAIASLPGAINAGSAVVLVTARAPQFANLRARAPHETPVVVRRAFGI